MSRPPAVAPQVTRVRGLLVTLGVGGLVVAAALTVTTGRAGVSQPAPAALPVADGVVTQSAPRGSVSGVAYATAAAGTCLDWTAVDLRDLRQVGCAEPHKVEVAGTTDLALYPTAEFGPSAPFPSTARFATLRDEICAPLVDSYLGGRLDPFGIFSVALVNPGQRAWQAGERTMRCGLQQADRSGNLAQITGRVADLDQSDVTAVGTCAGITDGLPSDPVPCTEPHASETVAVVDVAPLVTGSPPAGDEQDRALEPVCTRAADEYLGGPGGAANAQLTVFWDDVRPASWLVGSSRVNCYVGRSEPGGGGFAALTTPLRPDAPPPAGVTSVAPAPPAEIPAPTPGPAGAPSATPPP